MSIYIQYIIVGIAFIFAIYYLFKKFTKKGSGSCNKGCGCDFDTHKE